MKKNKQQIKETENLKHDKLKKTKTTFRHIRAKLLKTRYKEF